MRNIWNIGSNELFFFSIGKVILIGIFITLIFLSSTIEDLLDECSSYKLVYQIDNIKDNDYFKYLDIKKMNSENESDRKMIEDYWTKTKKKEKVDGREVADVTYFS